MPNSPSILHPSLAGFAALITLASFAAGCAGPRYNAFPTGRAIIELPADPSEPGPRMLPMFAGTDGSPLVWADLLDACDWAQIIIIGEQHDDGMGHAVQLAVVEDVMDRTAAKSSLRGRIAAHDQSDLVAWQPTPFALSMEMLERDEQILADDYLEDIIDTDAFIRLTHSANWGGEGKWEEWFQPIVDAAKDRGNRVIAANAPRRYVRLARLQGYDRLRQLPPERQAMFDLPRASEDALAAYRERFGEVMRHVHDDDPADGEPPRHEAHHEQRIDAAFRSQLLWDSTMAASILCARSSMRGPGGRSKVIHLVGQFHSDFDGGLVQEIRARSPQARILTISMQRVWQRSMREADRNRADIIIYTGERPPPPPPPPELDSEPHSGGEPDDE